MLGDVQVVVSVHISTTTSGCPKALLDSKVRCSALHTYVFELINFMRG